MGNTLLLDSNISSTCERTTIKRMIISRGKNKRYSITYLDLYTRQSCLVCIYLLQGLTLPILTVVSLWYFSGCFSFVFLEGCYLILSSKEMLVIFLHLDHMIQKTLVFSKKTIFLAITLFQSCFRYSNHFSFSFSSTNLHFLAFFFIFAFATFLAF